VAHCQATELKRKAADLKEKSEQVLQSTMEARGAVESPPASKNRSESSKAEEKNLCTSLLLPRKNKSAQTIKTHWQEDHLKRVSKDVGLSAIKMAEAMDQARSNKHNVIVACHFLSPDFID